MAGHVQHTGTGDGPSDEARAAAEWQLWHERRTAVVSGPYGPLALTGTHWLDDHPDGRIPGLPGRWTAEGDAVRLAAAGGDGLTLDGAPFTGEARLTADHGPIGEARAGHGARRFPVLHREGLWAVRDFDPGAPARRAFAGIETTPYHPRWVLPGRYLPYPERTGLRVRNADGAERGLGLDGEIVFELGGAERTLRVAVEDDGSLWAVFSDPTGTGDSDGGNSGNTSYRFRFLRPRPPAADGTVTVDFNRALLPPCAFADHFICPFPPPGNTLPVPVTAGERRALIR
ncbi:DUF1684 domain-containing protein [Streptomyces sp. NPDC094448]|uniref:DUF1684 domain-containing protein n=1 Tax=Streptomyces sp. NPDC094448 TaxID=3366063 RepID=UPI0037F12638